MVWLAYQQVADNFNPGMPQTRHPTKRSVAVFLHQLIHNGCHLGSVEGLLLPVVVVVVTHPQGHRRVLSGGGRMGMRLASLLHVFVHHHSSRVQPRQQRQQGAAGPVTHDLVILY